MKLQKLQKSFVCLRRLFNEKYFEWTINALLEMPLMLLFC